MPLHDSDFIPTSKAADLLQVPRTMIKSLPIPRHDIGARQVAYRAGDVFNYAADPENSEELVRLREVYASNAIVRARRDRARKKHR